MFFAALGKEKKLLALAKADRGFVGQRNISGGEGDIDSASGQCEAEKVRCRWETTPVDLDSVASLQRGKCARTCMGGRCRDTKQMSVAATRSARVCQRNEVLHSAW